jgi:hypothetical protein
MRRHIGDLFKLHPIQFVPGLDQEAALELGRINYHLIRHHLERNLKSYELLKKLGD